MADLNLNTVPPEEQTPPVVETNKVETPKTETPPVVTTEPPKVETPQADSLFETINKKYGTQYKAEDELKQTFELPKKVKDYETRLSDYEVLKKSADERQRKIEELEGLNDPLRFFSSPEAYKAEQLRIKYPDRDANLLHEIVTGDVNKMSDFDVLIKATKMFTPNLPRGGEGLREVLEEKYGIEPGTRPEDWDVKVQTKIALDAATQRRLIGELRNEIQLPTVVTKEERELAKADLLEKRKTALAPVRDQFTKFDKFKIGDFEYDVPVDYKDKTSELFDGMFEDAGLEMNEENLKTALQLRDANFLYENFGKIKDVLLAQGRAEIQTKTDKELHNETPPNQATRTDQVTGEEQLQGIGKLISDLNR